jgi:hypothetical protein
MMSKFKLYKAVGWDQTSQTYTGKTEPVKWVRIHNLPVLFISTMLSTSLLLGIDVRTCHGPVETYEIQKQFAINNGMVY